MNDINVQYPLFANIENYIRNIAELESRSDTSERSYVPSLKTLLEECATWTTSNSLKPVNKMNSNVDASQFTIKSELINKNPISNKLLIPDFALLKDDEIIGYLETKQIGEKLDKIIKSEQIKNYQALTESIIVTDFLRFIWIYKDNVIRDVQLLDKSELKYFNEHGRLKGNTEHKKYKLEEGKVLEFINLIQDFLTQDPPKITTSKQLASLLAKPALAIKEFVEATLHKTLTLQTHDTLKEIYKIFEAELVKNMTVEDFADAFSQTLVYSLFIAQLQNEEMTKLTLCNVQTFFPSSMLVISKITLFFGVIIGEGQHDKSQSLEYAEVRPFVDRLLAIINNIDLETLGQNLLFPDKAGQIVQEKDPYIYFYEDFLTEYSPETRKSRGVFYTPPEIVTFIVRSIDEIIREEFGVEDGMGDININVLDFATGTGTFMLECYKQVLSHKSDIAIGTKSKLHYIQYTLLKQISGFEVMVAPYCIAHLRLSSFLKSQGFHFDERKNKELHMGTTGGTDSSDKEKPRIPVYLTNTLEEVPLEYDKKKAQNQQFENFDPSGLFHAVRKEREKACDVKENPIFVVLGNPPYNSKSQNPLLEDGDLANFHKKYKPTGETSINSINDDYIKFIAFAHQKIQHNQQGIIGIVVNNSFLKGLTHRRMRNELMKDFNSIYVIDLHGNQRNKVQTKVAKKDENVFNVMVGICVIILVKNPQSTKQGVFHVDLFGSAKEKLKALLEIDLNGLEKLKIEEFNSNMRSTKWGGRFSEGLSFFNNMANEESSFLRYGSFWGLGSEVFINYATGTRTRNDTFCVHFEKQDIESVVLNLTKRNLHDICHMYNINAKNINAKPPSWSIDRAQKSIVENWQYNIRPMLYRPFDERWTYFNNGNGGFLAEPRTEVMKHMVNGDNFGLLFSRFSRAEEWSNISISESISCEDLTGSTTYLAPLYLYNTDIDRQTKEPNFKHEFSNMINKQFNNPTPESVLCYIYAILHSPTYRSKYCEFLKIDFPRIPFDNVSIEIFNKLSIIGSELIENHLLKTIPNINIGQAEKHPDSEENYTVEFFTYDSTNKRIYFNKTSYFASVEENVNNFKIGTFTVLEHYIKARKGRNIYNELNHITNVIKVLSETLHKMNQIDALTKEWV